jgi:hypothetical protein
MFAKSYPGLHTIISGGQTGADQGGLMAAFENSVKTGGTAPAKYMTTRGPAPLLQTFGLKAEGTLQTRTKRNIIDSDGTVILSSDLSSAGTLLTIRLCKELCKPYLVLDISDLCETIANSEMFQISQIRTHSIAVKRFILDYNISVLNVAGNRERYDDLRVMYSVKTVVSDTLKLLAADNLLITKGI